MSPSEHDPSDPSTSRPGWFRLAGHPATVRRAAMTAFTVGPILISINHGPAILRGEVTVERVAQMILTIVVPYLVSTVSSVSTRREMLAQQSSAAVDVKLG